MNSHRFKFSFEHGVVSSLHSIRWTRRPSKSLSVEPPPPLTGGEGNSGSHYSSVHWTARWKYSLSLERKGLFAETLLGEVIRKGSLSIEEYFIFSEILFLIKIKTRNFHLKRLAIALEIVLDQNQDLERRFWKVKVLYEKTGSDLLRIRGSRKKTYLPYSKIITIRAVPLETHINKKGPGIPYSSYCKGYGEGSSRGLEMTPISAELDGDDRPRVLDVRILKLVVAQIDLYSEELKLNLIRKED